MQFLECKNSLNTFAAWACPPRTILGELTVALP